MKYWNYINYFHIIKEINTFVEYVKNNYSKFIFPIILMLLSFLLLFFIVLIICSYYIFKYLKVNFVEDIYFSNYNYNKKTDELLKKYGDLKINKMYLVKNPLNNFNNFLLNLITFYNYEKKLHNMNTLLNKNYIPYHVYLIVEIMLPDKSIKFLVIEKSSYVNVKENIKLEPKNIIKKIKFNKNDKNNENNITINCLLDETKNRIGIKKFFNWSIYKNNCYIFIKELLITMNILNSSNKKFINQNRFVKYIRFSKFTLHIINFLCSLNNLCNNYIHYNQ